MKSGNSKFRFRRGFSKEQASSEFFRPSKRSPAVSWSASVTSCVLILAAVLVSVSGCQTNDYEPLLVKAKLKEMEDRLAKIESQLAAASGEAGPAAVSSISKMEPAKGGEASSVAPGKMQIEDRVDGKADLKNESLLPAVEGTAKPAEPKIQPELGLAETIALLEGKGGLVRSDASGAVVELNLVDCDLSDKELSNLLVLTDLETLVTRTGTTSPLAYQVIGGLKKLKHLELERSAPTVDDLIHLKSLPNLVYLQLFRATLSDEAMGVIAEFPKLEQLRCGQTRVGDEALALLPKLQTLRAIDLSDCNRVSDQGLAELAKLPELIFVKVWGPKITDAGMEHVGQMKKLRVLGLNDTAVTDAGIAKLSGLSELSEISLFRTSVGDAGIEVLANLSKLSNLNLRDTKLSDRGFAALAKLPNLQRLDLSETNSPGLTEASASLLGQLSEVRDLNLWSTNTSDTMLQAIGKLPNLTRLNLDNTRITDQGMEPLSQMSQLSWLHVGSTEITDAAVPKLLALKGLKYLNISHTKISEDGFYELDDEFFDRKSELIGP